MTVRHDSLGDLIGFRRELQELGESEVAVQAPAMRRLDLCLALSNDCVVPALVEELSESDWTLSHRHGILWHLVHFKWPLLQEASSPCLEIDWGLA